MEDFETYKRQERNDKLGEAPLRFRLTNGPTLPPGRRRILAVGETAQRFSKCTVPKRSSKDYLLRSKDLADKATKKLGGSLKSLS